MSNRYSIFCDNDSVDYRLVDDGFVSSSEIDGRTILKIDSQALSLLAETAFRDISFKLRTSHLQQIANILNDDEASVNDKFVATTLLRNAAIAVDGELPLCQDTGTAIVYAEKGECVWTSSDNYSAITQGIGNAYKNNNLRYSQVVAQTMCSECNSATNLPPQIDIHAVDGDEMNFLFIAKGGGSANKTMLFQETKALLNPQKLQFFLEEKIRNLGTSACPPYHIAIVVGGTSADENLKMVKLASAKCLDNLPFNGDGSGSPFRDFDLEQKLLQSTRTMKFGAQFGGKYFALDVRVVRLSRHGASCPVGIGVSCVADRIIRGKINSRGLWLQKLEDNPERFIAQCNTKLSGFVTVDLDRPMRQITQELSTLKVGTPLLLNGYIVVARDIAHAKLKERLDSGQMLPEYFVEHPIYYAGPAKTPVGKPSGSFGPTTAGRMDSYIEQFQEQGACLITIAKGNRSKAVTDSCKKYGGFYLGSIGGAAATLAHDCIKNVELIEFPELGMEAIYKIRVENFPAFILVDDKGNEFYER